MDKVYQTVENLHKQVRFFLLGSLDREGFPNIKVVLPVKERISLKAIYFSTNTSSLHVAQYRAKPQAAVYFFDGLAFKGVMLKGTMEVLEDAKTKAHFWNKGDVVYYPLGASDPDYCILRFTPTSGRYYHNFKSIDFTL